jgi:pimeloyl-ACP methyl ester carboxylesterase
MLKNVAAAYVTKFLIVVSLLDWPTLVIVETDDAPLQDALMLAERIPGSWIVQIRDAGHGLMYQYPNEFKQSINYLLRE